MQTGVAKHARARPSGIQEWVEGSVDSRIRCENYHLGSKNSGLFDVASTDLAQKRQNKRTGRTVARALAWVTIGVTSRQGYRSRHQGVRGRQTHRSRRHLRLSQQERGHAHNRCVVPAGMFLENERYLQNGQWGKYSE